MTFNERPIDVIIRTKNSQELLKECLESVIVEIPIRRVIIVDGGSIDRTKDIALSYDIVEFYSKPELNLGEATKFGFSRSQTEWVAVIDSDVILRQGWFDNMKKHMDEADAVEGCRVDHYLFTVRTDITKSNYGRFGQTLLKREPVLHMDMNLQYGEDTVTKFNFDKEGKRWKKVENFLADHYTKLEDTKHYRTGLVFRPEPQVIFVPKSVQIQQGHVNRKCGAITKKEAIKRLLVPPIYEAYWSFKRNFWFTLAYFKVIQDR